MHVNKVTVALAAKIARVAWAIITMPGALYERRGSGCRLNAGTEAESEARGSDDETASIGAS